MGFEKGLYNGVLSGILTGMLGFETIDKDIRLRITSGMHPVGMQQLHVLTFGNTIHISSATDTPT